MTDKKYDMHCGAFESAGLGSIADCCPLCHEDAETGFDTPKSVVVDGKNLNICCSIEEDDIP
ncbi:hypothetical protein LCGC14_2204540 [marine sediment metagenome]|uniref:Uncharacterized protein n=1 Tax=marine sediment metagenome TaxID=412755 RepID=A0A0F9DFW7_9ZZZZ